MLLNFKTFQFSVLNNFWSILILILFFLGGGECYPKSPPKKFKNRKKWKVSPVTSYNTQFLLKNLFMEEWY